MNLFPKLAPKPSHSHGLESALQDAGKLAFHPAIKSDYLSIRGNFFQAPDLGPWSSGLANICQQHSAFSEFIESCKLHSGHILAVESTEMHVARFLKRGAAPSKETREKAEHMRLFMCEHFESAHWEALVIFSLARGLTTTVNAEIQHEKCSAMTLITIELESLFVQGEWQAFADIFTQQYLSRFPVEQSLALQMCKQASISLACMAVLDSESRFFQADIY